ncbi:MAG TPA: hypothetical protein VF365_12955 [Candidatus Limnocylindria bacterium]
MRDPLRDVVADALLAAVQTYAEDDGCGEITVPFIDHAAQVIVDEYRRQNVVVTG